MTFNSKGGFFMFLRAQFSSQMSSLIDFLTTIIIAKLGLYYVYASFLGSVSGGIFNCFINYRWTFHAHNCRIKNVIFKYISVWIGSILLNTYGTYALTESLRQLTWVREVLSYYFADFFIIPKIVVSLLVGFFWNYQLQRVFVYRNMDLKGFFKK